MKKTIAEMGPKVRPQAHLLNLFSHTQSNHPNYALLLGAGASISSGVSSAKALIEKWRQQVCTHEKVPPNEKDKFVKESSWYDCPEEYSILFEKLYDHPSQRREVIESLLEKAAPSWGYIYLVNLLRKGYINTVLTTNFDDLLNEACHRFSSEVKPLVCSHDSSISSIRITSKRPKIIKLHGDFLFDNIKNTLSELESLESNMRDKFRQFATEYGLIVVGYAGNDRTVMDSLESLLKDENKFPHGVYWCLRKDSIISPKLDAISRHPKFRFVEIESFDDLFANIHASLNLDLQVEMVDPYKALATRLNSLIDSTRIYPESAPVNPIIDKDIKNLAKNVAVAQGISDEKISSKEEPEVKSAPSAEVQGSGIRVTIPFLMLARVAEEQKKFDEAWSFALREFKQSGEMASLRYLFNLLSKGSLANKVDASMKLWSENKHRIEKDLFIVFTLVVSLITLKKYDEAVAILTEAKDLSAKADASVQFDTYWMLNRLQIKTFLNEPFLAEELEILSNAYRNGVGNEVKMGAAILLGNYEMAETLFEKIKKEDANWASQMETWPIMKILRHKDMTLGDVVVGEPV